MGSKNRLVVMHLENVSGVLFEKYPKAIKEMVRGQSGIYALYRRGNLYYVGLASDLMKRLKDHLKDKHKKKWDRFSVYLTVRDEHMKEMESLLLRIVSPKGNDRKGRFVESENLEANLNKMMSDADADRRAQIMGGKIARRRRKTKTGRGKEARVLAGLVERRMVLIAWHGKYEYRATLLKDGSISYDGNRYDFPTGAARAAIGRRANGWKFWHYKEKGKKDSWIPLDTLRK